MINLRRPLSLVLAGAEWSTNNIERDGTLITANGSNVANRFAKEILAACLAPNALLLSQEIARVLRATRLPALDAAEGHDADEAL